MPDGLAIEVASNATLSEPAFLHLPFQRDRAPLALQPIAHDIAATHLTGVTVGLPGNRPSSDAALALEASDLLSFTSTEEYLLHLTFNRWASRQSADLRPSLPLILEW